MEDKRKIGGWEVLQSILIGDKEVVLLHDPNNAEATYAACYCRTTLGILESTEGVGSNDYLEMMEDFLHRVQGQIDRVRAEREHTNEPREVFGKESCLPSDGAEADLHGCVVVIKPDMLRHEYRSAAHQAVYVTHGFGASANARGSAIFGYNVFTGEQQKLRRYEVLGILDPIKAPDWVKCGVEAILAKPKEKGGRNNER